MLHRLSKGCIGLTTPASRMCFRPMQIAAKATQTALSVDAKNIELDATTAPAVLKDLDCIMFDCDGVLWTGATQIPGAQQALVALREQGKRVLFVTNNASKSRAGYVSKFKSFGLQVEPHEIISASYAAAAYLESVGFKQTGKKVLLLGFTGVEEELTTAGIPWIGGTAWDPPKLTTADDLTGLTIDSDIGAVVCSWDPGFNYTKLVYASSCLRELPDCLFVVTNPDDADNIGRPARPATPGEPLPGMIATSSSSSSEKKTTVNGAAPSSQQAGVPVERRMQPGTGCLQAAVEAGSGRKAVVVGKGGPWLVPFLLQHFNLDPSRTAIVGDRLDTDVALGLEGGLKTFLPLTGVTRKEQVLGAAPEAAPHYIMPSVAALAGMDPSTSN